MWAFRQSTRSSFIWLISATLLLVCSFAHADERILRYHSVVKIHTDGTLTVTETIKVRAEGNNIRRGIYRDFPTRYKDRLGNHYTAELNVLSVHRNGATEPFHTENRSNGIRIYIGSANQNLDHGEHEYRLQFSTNRQLGYFKEFDELYWNVTGSGWVFPINHASARIELPVKVEPGTLRTNFYTGPQGSGDKHAEARIIDGSTILFQTTQGLQAREGLTVAVGWPKNIVTEPGTSTRLRYFLSDNGAALALLMGLLGPLAWYLWAWNQYGRDPRKGVIIPRFKPPAGLTPAACSYVSKMSFGVQAFPAAIISLGVKGYVEIHEDDDDFTLHLKSSAGTGTASKGERATMDELFEEETTLELDDKNHRVFGKAQSALRKALKAEYLGKLFNINSVYALPGFIMTIIAVLASIKLNGGPLLWIVFAVLSGALHATFTFLMRAPTPAGRRIMDEIEGFKMYLDTAEQDRLERMRSPELTPELFETFLPYAFALGVENHWCDRFTREFPQDPGQSSAYNPAWYSGSRSGLSALSYMGSDFGGSFTSAISSASSPPGSSSGSGGGSSGGGGGGGGGGGW